MATKRYTRKGKPWGKDEIKELLLTPQDKFRLQLFADGHGRSIGALEYALVIFVSMDNKVCAWGRRILEAYDELVAAGRGAEIQSPPKLSRCKRPNDSLKFDMPPDWTLRGAAHLAERAVHCQITTFPKSCAKRAVPMQLPIGGPDARAKAVLGWTKGEGYGMVKRLQIAGKVRRADRKARKGRK